MSETVQTARRWAAPERLWPLWLLGLHVVCNWTAWHSFDLINDEAVTVLGAHRWLAGEWPYADWTTRHSPGSYAVTAVWFLLFGESSLSTRSLMMLIGGLQSCILFRLAAPLSGWVRWLPSLCWSCLGMQLFPVLSYHWMAVLAYSWLALCTRDWKDKRQAGWVGAGLALSLWLLQSEGLAGVLLVAAFWVWRRPSGLVRLLLGGAAASAVLWLPFVGSLAEVWHQSFGSMGHHVAFNRFLYTWSQLLPWWTSLAASSPSGDPLGWSFSLLSGLAMVWRYGAFYPLLGLAIWRAWRCRDADLAFVCLATACLTLANFGRQTAEYLAFPDSLWFVVACWEMSRWGRRRWAATGVAALAVAQLCLAGAVRARDARWELQTPFGTYWFDDPTAASAYSQLGAWTERYRLRGQNVLCGPYQPCLFTLWELRNPLRVPVLLPFSYGPEDVEAAADQRDAARTEWEIFTPLNPYAMASITRFTPAEIAAEQNRLLARLGQGFQVQERSGGMLLLHRSPTPAGAP